MKCSLDNPIRPIVLAALVVLFLVVTMTGKAQADDEDDDFVGTENLLHGAVTESKIADGAVTTGKLAAGAVTLDKLDPNIDLGGGIELLRTFVVSPVGPTASDNCDELLATLDGITDNGPDNPYLIKIEPGIYDCGTTQVAMKPFVDMEGSGAGVTTILGNPNTFNTRPAGGLIIAASNSELRQLAVEHTGGTEFAVAIDIPQSTNPRITDVDVRLRGTVTEIATGITIGDIHGFTPALLSNVRVTALGGSVIKMGIVIAGGARLENIFVDALGGIAIGAGPVTIRDSIILGGRAIEAFNVFDTAIISTQVAGQVNADLSLRCVGAYDHLFEPLDGFCQPLAAP